MFGLFSEIGYVHPYRKAYTSIVKNAKNCLCKYLSGQNRPNR